MSSIVSALSVKNVTVMYQDTVALNNVSVEVPVGSLLAIIGPNGAGKTSFMKSVLGLLQPIAGTISLFGKTLNEQRHKVAYVPQRMSVDWDFPINVYDVVMMGRYGALGWFSRPRAQDKRIVLESLEQVNLQAHAYKPIGQLSGGQQQRVFFARALAQQAELYLLDEPFINIDGTTEHALVCLLQALTKQGKTVIVVHHDLHTVRAYFESALLLNVQVIAQGSVDTVVAPLYLERAYGSRPSGAAQEKDSVLWR